MLLLKVQSALELLKACLSRSPELHQPCKKVEVDFRPKFGFGEGEVEQDQEGIRKKACRRKETSKRGWCLDEGLKGSEQVGPCRRKLAFTKLVDCPSWWKARVVNEKKAGGEVPPASLLLSPLSSPVAGSWRGSVSLNFNFDDGQRG